MPSFPDHSGAAGAPGMTEQSLTIKLFILHFPLLGEAGVNRQMPIWDSPANPGPVIAG